MKSCKRADASLPLPSSAAREAPLIGPPSPVGPACARGWRQAARHGSQKRDRRRRALRSRPGPEIGVVSARTSPVALRSQPCPDRSLPGSWAKWATSPSGPRADPARVPPKMCGFETPQVAQFAERPGADRQSGFSAAGARRCRHCPRFVQRGTGRPCRSGRPARCTAHAREMHAATSGSVAPGRGERLDAARTCTDALREKSRPGPPSATRYVRAGAPYRSSRPLRFRKSFHPRGGPTYRIK